MSFRQNQSQQVTFSDDWWGLTDREKRALEKSWAKTFADDIFPNINEEPFNVLYSDKASRPNTPVNIIVIIFRFKTGQFQNWPVIIFFANFDKCMIF